MMLLTVNYERLHCIETLPPKMYKDLALNWDCLNVDIDGKNTKMFFNNKNNRSYFYFNIFNTWYKTKIVTDEDLDVWDYIEKYRRLFVYHNTR